MAAPEQLRHRNASVPSTPTGNGTERCLS